MVRRLREEFPDVSISKIRYLEDEGLLAPRRTQGGYRLFSTEDLERLQTILRLQRDEFLPLRVIREELDAPGANERKRRRPSPLGAQDGMITIDELCDRARVAPELAKELEDFGLLAPKGTGGEQALPGVRRRCGRDVRASSRATASLRATCACSGRRPAARRRCSGSSSHLSCAPAAPNAARRPCATCNSWLSWPQSSLLRSSGAT